MLDIQLIREQPDLVKEAAAKKNVEAPVDEILALDAERRQRITEVERLKSERNAGSKLVSKTRDPQERQERIEAMRALGDQIDAMDIEVREIDQKLRGLMLVVPNIAEPVVPVGPDAEANEVVLEGGEKRAFAFDPRPHWEIAEELGIIDFDRGVKVAGSRFYFLRGDGSRLQRALITWMLDVHIRQHGYQEVSPPYLVTGEMLVGTSNLPKFADTLFRDIEDDKWMIPTAEVPVTNMYRDEILDVSLLPIYHCAFSPCFRREQLSGGRDVRGIKRGYQFDKVEMVKFTAPEQSQTEHEKMLQDALDIARLLDVPYHVLRLSTGDMSFGSAHTYDIELWAPGSQEWLEVSSVSNFHDFQARRANLRYRPDDGGRPQFLHTLNGSGLALPRVLITILETYQNEDGTVTIPEVVRPYMGGQEMIGRQPPPGPAHGR